MRVILVALVGLLLAGCQVRVSTDVTVAADGSGDVALRLVVDDELRDALVAEGVDLREGLREAAGATWTVAPVDREDATGVELRTTFADEDELGERVDALMAGLAADDGALLRDVRLTRSEDGGYVFNADAGLDPPRILGVLPLPSATTGVVADADGAPAAFDGDALGDLLAASGDRYAVAELRVTMPTVPVADGATVERTSATWELPVDGLTAVSATAPPVPVQGTTGVVAAAGLGGLLVGAFAVRALRRRP